MLTKEELTEELGYEPSNPEVIGILMASVDLDDQLVDPKNSFGGD